MRSIKFRAWLKDENKMAKVHSIHLNKKRIMVTYRTTYGASGNCAVDDGGYVLQQYTGLKDKNGIEIYEGDIANWCEDSYIDEGTKPATIVWHEQEGWQCIWYKEDGSESFRDPLYVYVNEHNFKVIGNIFEGVDK